MSRNILTPKLMENLQSEIKILKGLSHRHITELKEILVSLCCHTSQLAIFDRYRTSPMLGISISLWNSALVVICLYTSSGVGE